MDAVETKYSLGEKAMNGHGREGYPRTSSMFKNSSHSSHSTGPQIGLSEVVLETSLLY